MLNNTLVGLVQSILVGPFKETHCCWISVLGSLHIGHDCAENQSHNFGAEEKIA